jgi:hypothetical protein
MARSIRFQWQTLQAQTSGLLAVSCIAWLGLLPLYEVMMTSLVLMEPGTTCQRHLGFGL